MVKNSDFFRRKEKENIDNLNLFNELKGFFESVTKTPQGFEWDASGITVDGRVYNAELKTRDAVLTDAGTVSGVNFNDSTVILESDKAAPLLFDYLINGRLPLYINFLQDGTVLIWNLSNLKKRPIHEPVVINNKGYDKMYKGYREYLPVSEAIIYPKLLKLNEG